MINIGIVLFEGFQALDAFGPMDCINVLSRTQEVSLAIIASSLEPVSTKPPGVSQVTSQRVLPTHTFADAPDLDVLIIPGGMGTRSFGDHIQEAVDFIKNRYPQLKYLLTVCTGSGLAARAGVLDGKKATTNKRAWKEITAWRTEVQWVAQARWIVDGNIWTSSGVSAGIDVTLAWIGEVYGDETAQQIADGMEYTRHPDAAIDDFARLHGL